MLTKRTKAYSSSGSVVTHRSTNRARRRVTSFQSKRITNYATPPTPVPWRHLVNDIDLRSQKSLKSLTPASDRRPDDGKDARSILLSHAKRIKAFEMWIWLKPKPVVVKHFKYS